VAAIVSKEKRLQQCVVTCPVDEYDGVDEADDTRAIFKTSGRIFSPTFPHGCGVRITIFASMLDGK